ncbi:MAG: arylsulfatase, partial [Verrucomicrobiae bacterium]|nr:arylsulfatase [Verrucomicrobiae bacterium]
LVFTVSLPSLKADPPNILFLLMDDLGYGDLACYNAASKIPTPNLDQLAREGMRFTNAHTPSGVCSPTRYAVLTGRYCWRTRLKTGVLQGDSPPLIEEERLTVADLLKSQAYQTAHVGKWHLGHTWHLLDESKPITVDNIDWSQPMKSGVLHQGFEYSYGLGKPAWVFAENDKVLAVPSEPFDLGEGSAYFMGGNNNKGYRSPGYSHEQMLPRFTEKAVQFIHRAAQSEKPFFLYFAPITPHKPVVPNKEFIGKSGAGIYGDFVVEMDHRIGQILHALDSTGEANNTLIFFTADNGPENIAYDRIKEHGHYSMADWRGVKRDLWEGGNRVPFIVRWPGKVEAGSINGETVSLVDFMATTAAVVEQTLPDNAAEDSYNILPTLHGQNYKRPLREATVYHGSNGVLAIRQGDWVLIDGKTGMVSNEPEWFREERGVQEHSQPRELFNLANDPQELENQYSRQPAIADRMKKLLDRYVSTGRSRP